jgi:lysophospholipase L1-like esterase
LFRLVRSTGRSALALAISAAIGLVLSELIVRVVYRHSMDFDMEMWRYATSVKVASSDPRVGHEHGANRQAHLMGVDVSTESHGLRDRERTLDKPADTFRILALGDSITMGWGVPQDETYPAQLERKLNAATPERAGRARRFEVLNLGIGNYNTDQELVRLERLGLGFHPDLILLGYFVNDAEPTQVADRGFWIEHSYLYAFILSRLRRLRGQQDHAEYYRGLYDPARPGWRSTVAALGELATIGREHHIPVVVFLIPELHDLKGDNPFADVYAEVEKVCHADGLPVIDLYPLFRGRTPETRLWVDPGDAHPNAEGQGILATGMAEALQAYLQPGPAGERAP